MTAKKQASKAYTHIGDGVQIHLPECVMDFEPGEPKDVPAECAAVVDTRPDFEPAGSKSEQSKETKEVSK